MRRKALKQKKNWNPALFGIRNPVLGIRNPQGGIQNPRLSWIPLHGAKVRRQRKKRILFEKTFSYISDVAKCVKGQL